MKLFALALPERALALLILTVAALPAFAADPAARTYRNELRRIEQPTPILSDHPEFVAPVAETARFEAPALVDDAEADLEVRAWRFSYNARAIIEMPNRLRAR